MRAIATALLCMSVALCHPASVRAQPRFESWTTENGLPQNSIRDILQTRDGYLWLATEGGLVRFDGVRFVVFDRSVPGIGSLRVGALREDRHGTLWAGTTDGKVIRYEHGRFTTLDQEDGLPSVPSPAVGVARIEEDDRGDLWITWLDRVTRLAGTAVASFVPGDFALPPVHRQRYLDHWWRQDGTTLLAFVAGRGRTFTLPSAVAAAGVTGVSTDSRGTVWIRSAGAGVLQVSATQVQHHTVKNGLPHDAPDGWFHGDGRGSIWYFDRRGGRVYRTRNGAHEWVGLAGGRSFHVDREGSSWIGTVAHGLHRLRDEIFTMLTEKDGLSLDRTYSIVQDRSGAIWIGTWDGGLNRYAEGRFTTYGLSDGLPSLRITCIYEDRRGRLWVGTDEGLTYRTGTGFAPYEPGDGPAPGPAWSIREDRHGRLWIGTAAGLFVQDASGGPLTRFTTADGLSNDSITALFEDRSGALWIGSYQGLTRLRDGVFTRFAEPEGLVGHEVRALHEDANGQLWVGTYDGGLYRVVGDRVTRFTRNEGLHDNGVFQILEDHDGYFWMGSNRGLSRVSRIELDELAAGRRRTVGAAVFGTADGLRSVEFNGGRQPSGLKTADGRLWFPTMAGVAVIDPAAAHPLPVPRPVIEEVRVGDAVMPPPLSLTVPTGTDVFEILYTAPTFLKPHHVRFRYRLTGLSEAWIDAGERRRATFSGVPPGNYTFVLSASNLAGEWSSDGPTLSVVVQAPFWGTWWFRLLGAGLLASGLYGLHAARVRRLERERAQRSVYLQELIDAQEQERARISNEVHDSLGYDVAMVKQRIREGLERSSLDPGTRRDFDEILSLTNRIDDDMRTIAHALRPYHLDKIGLTRSLQELASQIATGLALTVDIAPIDDLLAPEAEIHVYRIVQESLANVVRHAGARRATLSVSTGGPHVEIRIEDDGEGFGHPDTWRPQGLGLIGIRERAQVIGGVARMESRPGAGTSVVVRVPTRRPDEA
jgi:ligand-binding sensor domain-containing protein/signal transduction histidine kinase